MSFSYLIVCLFCLLVHCVQSADPVEIEALKILYNDTNGVNWRNNTNWNSDEDPCLKEWFGVTCNNFQHIERLVLSDNQLIGTIPRDLGKLSNLSQLYLNNNQITGTIPLQLGNLSNLRELYLNNNQITGSIPLQLGNLSKLQFLSLDNNQISGTIPRELGNNQTSETITPITPESENNQISGTITPITRELGNNQISGSFPPELLNPPKLQHLSLSSNQITGSIPPELGNLSNLETLWLDNNQLCGIIPESLRNCLIPNINLNENLLYCPVPECMDISCVSTNDSYPFQDVPQNKTLECNTLTNSNSDDFQEWIENNANATLYSPFSTIENNWSGGTPECGSSALVTFTAKDPCGFNVTKNATFTIDSAPPSTGSETASRMNTPSKSISPTQSASNIPSESSTRSNTPSGSSTGTLSKTASRTNTPSSLGVSESTSQSSSARLSQSSSDSRSESVSIVINQNNLLPPLPVQFSHSKRPSHPIIIESSPLCYSCFEPTISIFLTVVENERVFSFETTKGTVLVIIPETSLSATQFTIEIQEIFSFTNDQIIKSPVIDIIIKDEFNVEVTQFNEPIEICIPSEGSKNDVCLSFYDENSLRWNCEDECPEEMEKNLLCGKTDHLTSFAMLLAGPLGRGNDPCEDSSFDQTITWLSFAFIIAAIAVVMLSIILIEIKVRILAKKREKEFRVLTCSN